MNITFNGESQISGMICFTDIPNILTLEDGYGAGAYAVYKMVFDQELWNYTDYAGQWTISVLGNTITNTAPFDSENAIGRNFYVSQWAESTAASVAKALRNCPTVFTSFQVSSSGDTVTLKGRRKGTMIGNNFSLCNIPSSLYSASTVNAGSSDSSFDDSLIDVDVIGVDDYGNDNYVTTLEKTFADGKVQFNVSPVLTTMSKLGKAEPFTLNISSYKNGETTNVGNITNYYVAQGYMCNQGDRWIALPDGGLTVAQNVSRGNSKIGDEINEMPLYVSKPTIPLSFYCHNLGGMTVTIEYLNSAYQAFQSGTTNWHNTDSSQKLKDYTVGLDERYFTSAFYVDVTLGTTKLRYRVIKPINAAEETYRVCWRNEYGGISFFDFTGQKSETRTMNNTTYKKNIFDYYTDPMNELELTYDNDVTYDTTLTSHLFENDGKYIFNSLAQSPYIWTEVNGEKYVILVNSISVEEVENNIYKATIKYKLSQKPSLL